jgi:hypothetical protein
MNNFTPLDRRNHKAGEHQHRVQTNETVFRRRVKKLLYDNPSWSLTKARARAQEQMDAEAEDQ